VIIPAAGFGTRVGSPPAKELLPHPKYKMSFLEKALERVLSSGAKPLVISRVDKTHLNRWLFESKIPHILVTPTFEWVETVMLSSPYWVEKNLLLLPDADFSPETIIHNLLHDLDHFDLSFGVFDVLDIQKWGAVIESDGKFFITEKYKSSQPGTAWGLIAFQKGTANQFWEIYQQSQLTHQWLELAFKLNLRRLDYFEDLTR